MHIVDVALGAVVDRYHPTGRVDRLIAEVLNLEIVGRAGPGFGDEHDREYAADRQPLVWESAGVWALKSPIGRVVTIHVADPLERVERSAVGVHRRSAPRIARTDVPKQADVDLKRGDFLVRITPDDKVDHVASVVDDRNPTFGIGTPEDAVLVRLLLIVQLTGVE